MAASGYPSEVSDERVPAIPGSMIRLVWTQYGFEEFLIYRHYSIGDGHCLLHSVANAIYIPYRTGIHNGKPISRSAMMTGLRKEIADKLEKLDPVTGKTYYESIAAGNLALLGNEVPSYSLSGIRNLLLSSDYLGEESISIISHILKIEIYVLDLKTRDVYMFAECPNTTKMVVVCLYTGGHYDLVSVKSEGIRDYITHFQPSHSFIKFLRRRIGSQKADPI